MLYNISKRIQDESHNFLDVTEEFFRQGEKGNSANPWYRYLVKDSVVAQMHHVGPRGDGGTPNAIKPNAPCPASRLTFLLIMVASPIENLSKRKLVRLTWGAITTHNRYNIKLVFYMGKALNSSQQLEVETESRTHNDIVQSQIDDGFRHLALRTFEGFQWSISECPAARFLLKADDYTFVNVRNTVDYLKSMTAEDEVTLYQGYGRSSNPAFRNPGSRWYISYDEYRNGTYPPYNIGFAVLFSMKVVRDLHDASYKAAAYFHVRRDFPFEDVFIGICAKYLGIVPKFLPTFFRNPESFDKEHEKNNCVFLTTLAVYGADPKMFYFYVESGEKIRDWGKLKCT
jgi:hypothetical protein